MYRSHQNLMSHNCCIRAISFLIFILTLPPNLGSLQDRTIAGELHQGDLGSATVMRWCGVRWPSNANHQYLVEWGRGGGRHIGPCGQVVRASDWLRLGARCLHIKIIRRLLRQLRLQVWYQYPRSSEALCHSNVGLLVGLRPLIYAVLPSVAPS